MPDKFEHFYFVPTEEVEVIYTISELVALARDNKLSKNSIKKLSDAIGHHRFQLEELMIAMGKEDIPF